MKSRKLTEKQERLRIDKPLVNWVNDPINRINLDNGITLCRKCHANYHTELSNLTLSRGGD